MAYFVYPMNKTSRFIHSIGVMDIASEIFRYALINSRETDDYLTYVKSKIDLSYSFFSEFINELGKFTQETIKATYIENNIIDLESIYIKIAVEKMIGKELLNKFCMDDNLKALIFQALRLFALFHDVGHLPFSHVGEYAVINFLKNKEEENDHLKVMLKELSPNPHEVIGKKIANLIFMYLTEKVKKEYSEATSAHNNENSGLKEKIGEFIILNIIIQIYRKIEDKELKELYKIISSDLDSDRLDYTIRDGYATGIYNGSFDIDRIVKTFHLVKDGAYFKVLPSTKSLFDINRFFFDRYNLYKMVVNHHKVKRFDSILQVLIEKILEEEYNRKLEEEYNRKHEEEYNRKHLKNSNNLDCKDEASISGLMDMICVIYHLLKFDSKNKNLNLIERMFFRLAQLTDFWLLDIFKKELLSLIFEGKTGNEKFQLLNEILGGTKVIKSLYKRNLDFDDYFGSIDEKKIILLDNLVNIKDKIFITKIKEPEHPRELEMYDPRDKKVIKHKKIFQTFFSEAMKTVSFFVFFNSAKIKKKKEVIEVVKKEIEKEG